MGRSARATANLLPLSLLLLYCSHILEASDLTRFPRVAKYTLFDGNQTECFDVPSDNGGLEKMRELFQEKCPDSDYPYVELRDCSQFCCANFFEKYDFIPTALTPSFELCGGKDFYVAHSALGTSDIITFYDFESDEAAIDDPLSEYTHYLACINEDAGEW
jgi:hypothetical protein